MTEQLWNNAAPVGSLKAGAFLKALEELAPFGSSHGSSSLSGLMLYAVESSMEVTASDGFQVTNTKVPMDVREGLPGDYLLVVVPQVFHEVVTTELEPEPNDELEFAWIAEGRELLVRKESNPEQVLVTPTWDPAVFVDQFNANVAGGAVSTCALFEDHTEFTSHLQATSPVATALLGAVPGRVMFSADGQLTRFAAEVTGDPLRVEVEPTLLVRAVQTALRLGGKSLRALQLSYYPERQVLQVEGGAIETDGSIETDSSGIVELGMAFQPRHDFQVYVRAGRHPNRDEAPPRDSTIPAPPDLRVPALVENADAVIAQIEALPGFEEVKRQAQLAKRLVEANRTRLAKGLKGTAVSAPLVFVGAAGTGKSYAAELLARLYRALGVLSHDTVVEVNRTSLLDSHFSSTKARTAKQLIDEAMGGVLFIDDAYALAKDEDNDLIQSVVQAVLKAIEERQGEFLCIVADSDDNIGKFLAASSEIRTKFSRTVKFPPFDTDELVAIAQLHVADSDNEFSDEALDELRMRLRDHGRRGGFRASEWAGARSVKNLADRAISHRDTRVVTADLIDDHDAIVTIEREDVTRAADDFVIGRASGVTESVNDVMAELDALVGQPQLKRQVLKLLAQVKVAQAKEEQGLASGGVFVDHMIFSGPPGTGKTTIARLIARLYRALGVLPSGQVVEVDHGDLKGQYEGHTAAKTTQQIDKAMGGVLLIDEAYQLVGESGNDKFGQEAVATLLKRMEDDRGNFLVIAAGYDQAMEKFLKSNDGLRRRFPVHAQIAFTSYTANDLFEIAEGMVSKTRQTFTADARSELEERLRSAEKAGLFERSNWGNAGEVRNLIEATMQARDLRVHEGVLTAEVLSTLTREDVVMACEANGLRAGGAGEETVEDVLAELYALTGQAKLKREVDLLLRQIRMAQKLQDKGLEAHGNLVQHLVFTGPPGTGKTTVARLIARLYKALGLLPFGKLVEVTRSDLVGGHVGATAIKTSEKFNEAMGGVLFIDEAYSLAGAGQNDFGKEAIDTLVPLMENNRGKILVIAAGYTNDMVAFMNSNTGLASRFESTIEFEPYTAAEMMSIAEGNLAQKGLELEPQAREQLERRLATAERSGQFKAKDWGNARTMRKVVDRAQKELSGRLTGMDLENLDDNSKLITIVETDIVAALEVEALGGGASNEEGLDAVLAELDALIGQPQIKNKVREVLAAARAAQQRAERGIESSVPKLDHMLFVGPPGTGKTTIARLIARLYKAIGLLPKGQLIEVDRSGLVVGYVGQTAPKTNALVDQALGGVLFIDEAYTLVSDSGNDFGGEAIAALLKRLSDDEGQFLAIAAGYNDQMQTFVDYNPGLARRFPQTIEFVPYTADELAQIADHYAKKAGQTIHSNARAYLGARLSAAERAGVMDRADWGNAGSVINIVDAAVQRRDTRLFDQQASDDELITLTLVDVREACDRFGLPHTADTPQAAGQQRPAPSEPRKEPVSAERPQPARPDRNDIRNEMSTFVGEAVTQLAPGARSGQAVPAGPELTALGVEEVYWQGGSGMGAQFRTVAGSKDDPLYYFAGSRAGRLPAEFWWGRGVKDAARRDITNAPHNSLTQWQESGDSLADYILTEIRRGASHHE